MKGENFMKKIFALALAVIMMLSMATFAVAEDKPVITIAVADKTNVEDFNTNLQTLWLEEKPALIFSSKFILPLTTTPRST